MNMQVSPIKASLLKPSAVFEGDFEFSGFVQDLTGAVRRHYHGTIKCSRDGDILTLDEELFFNDGAQEKRIWTIDESEAEIFGDADDLIGQARIQSVSRDEMRWRYAMEIDIGGKRRSFDFEDVFVQTKDDTMISKTTMKKFGIPLARLYSSYKRVNAAA